MQDKKVTVLKRKYLKITFTKDVPLQAIASPENSGRLNFWGKIQREKDYISHGRGNINH